MISFNAVGFHLQMTMSVHPTLPMTANTHVSTPLGPTHVSAALGLGLTVMEGLVQVSTI